MNASPAFSEAANVWARIGCLSFGGPAGQIALMHREIVGSALRRAEKHRLLLTQRGLDQI